MPKKDPPKIYTLTPPPQAAAAGYEKLIFDDDFTDLDIAFGENTGQKWNAGLWWYAPPDLSRYEIQEGTILKITGYDDGTGPGGVDHVDLCTQFHDTTDPNGVRGGIKFLGGYFEARMCCFDWSSFWLFSWGRAWTWKDEVKPDDPKTWCSEIDILETDGGKVNTAWETLHKNTSGDGGVPDEQNWPNEIHMNVSPIGEWHDYGLLWRQEDLTWYIDGIPTLVVKPYESTWQPVQLIFGAAPKGVGGSPTATHPPITQIDWVRVWY